jgi:ribosomal protein S18 acetylase RimI-like enzyme
MPVEDGGIRLSALDTARFGFVTARVDAIEIGQLREVFDFCRLQRVQLLIARCVVEDLSTTHALGEAGFALMDTLVYYERDLLKFPLIERSSDDIELLQPEDIVQVEAIARSCFRNYSGHYHADPRLDREACTETYASWARSCCDQHGSGGFVLVAGDGRHRVGFSAFRRTSDDQGELVLGAVLPEARGAGLYRRLTIEGMLQLQSSGTSRFVTSTHVSNWSAQAAWIAAGLRPNRAYYTFHRWF